MKDITLDTMMFALRLLLTAIAVTGMIGSVLPVVLGPVVAPLAGLIGGIGWIMIWVCGARLFRNMDTDAKLRGLARRMALRGVCPRVSCDGCPAGHRSEEDCHFGPMLYCWNEELEV